MRVLCLTDFPVRSPDRWLWDFLPEAHDQVDFLWAGAQDRFGGWRKAVTRYPAYCRLASRAMTQASRSSYDIVVAWEANVGIPFALAKRWLGRRLPPFVLLAFNPGDAPRAAGPFIHMGLETVDTLTVLTEAEATAYQRRYGLPSSKISVSPLPGYDLLGKTQASAAQTPKRGAPYIHASGRSSRDYSTLIRAVTGLPVDAVIHGRGYNFGGLAIPPNVEIGDLASHDEYQRLVYNALFEVVPIQPRLRPAGSSQVVFAMMMGKPVVATRNPSLADLVKDGVTGLLVEPGDAAAMRAAILHLLDHPEERARMGAAARLRFEQRHSFEQFAQRTHQLLQQVCQTAQAGR